MARGIEMPEAQDAQNSVEVENLEEAQEPEKKAQKRRRVSGADAKMMDEAALQRAYGELEDKRRELAMSPKERGNPNPIENPLDVSLGLGQERPKAEKTEEEKPQPKKSWLGKLRDKFFKEDEPFKFKA